MNIQELQQNAELYSTIEPELKELQRILDDFLIECKGFEYNSAGGYYRIRTTSSINEMCVGELHKNGFIIREIDINDYHEICLVIEQRSEFYFEKIARWIKEKEANKKFENSN